MPIWLLKLLPYGAAALALIAAVLWINHEGYNRAENKFKQEQAAADVRQAREDVKQDQRAREIERSMAVVVTQVDEKLGTRLSSITQLEKTVIQPTLIKEINSAPRFNSTSPDVGITPGMLDALNAARGSSKPACIAGAIGSTACPLPPVAAPVKHKHWGIGH